MKENIFELVKQKLNPKDVVKDILGEPVNSGTDDTYHSPFCDGDNDPSFKVSNDYISDFSSKSDFGTGKDIFNFIVAYNEFYHFISDKSITDFEALRWLVSRYHLDIDVPDYFDNTYKLPKPFAEKQTTFSLVRSAYPPSEIWTMFDTEKFSKKPTGEEIGKIKNRIDSLDMYPYQYEFVKNSFEEGKTCIPAGIKSEKYWQDNVCMQQIFLVDIDNTETVEGEKRKYYVR